jgi:PAS domain S-box-containing protein
MDSMNQDMNENISAFNHNIRMAWILLTIGLIATASAAFYVRIGVESDIKRDFDFACNEIRLKIDARLNAHAQILRSGAALFDASDNVTREQWRAFIMHQQIEQQLPGIQGIGFSLLIPDEQLEQHIQEIRSQGFPEYKVKPEGWREFYTSVIYLEPFSGRNLRAFGYDMLTEPVRRAAMERARDADAAVLSGKVTLVQETEQNVQPGTLMYVPVYRRGMPKNKVEQRRAAIYGWVYSPYRMKDLMKGIMGGWDFQEERRIRLQIFDGEQMALLYDSQPGMESDSVSVFSVSSPSSFVGRRWTLRFISTGAKTDYSVWLVISAGTLISLLIFGLIISLFNTRFKARKIAEQLTVDLRESEENFRTFFDTIDHLLFVLDNTGNIIWVNQTVIKRLGFTKEELIGKNVLTVHPEEHRDEAGRIVSEMLEGKRDYCSIPVMSKDGKYIPAETRVVKGRWSGQDVLFGVSKDISDIKASEEKFSKIFYSNPSAMAISDWENGRFTDVNYVLLKKLGYERDELIGKTSAELGLFVDSGQRASLIKLLSEQGELKNYEIAIRRKSGDIRYGSFSAEILSLQSRKLLLTMMDDITERKQAEAYLKLNEARLESLLRISQYKTDNAKDLLNYALSEAIRLTGSKIGYIYYYNEASNQFTLNTWSEDVMKECRITKPQTLYHLNKTGVWGEVVRQRTPIIINDFQSPNPLKKGYPKGHALLYRFMTTPVIIEGKVEAVIGVANKSSDYDDSDARQLTLLMDSVWNIADRKRAEEELRKTKEAAEAANRAKSEFLASMSHELRTPLTGVLSLSEALIEEAYGSLNEKQLKALRSVESSGQHLLNLITDILDLSKIEAGQMELQIGKCSLSDICQSALQLTKGMANKKRHKVSFSMNPASISIDADPMRLKQMLVNLLSNAVKFTPEGGNITLEVRGDQAGHILCLSVKDTGIGIAPEMFHKLFKPFVQLDSSLSRRYSGTGLGLSLIRRMAELHGGSVTLESEVGKGSCFTISLPWKTSAPDMPDDSEDKTSGAVSDRRVIHTSEALILLVEDNEVNISLYLDYLESKGYRVAVGRTGREGVEKAAAFQPDLILMDIQMPDMDGLEAMRILRADTNPKIASTPIIALTSLAMPGDREKCIDSGADDYLSKPVHLSDLLKTIEHYLNRSVDYKENK